MADQLQENGATPFTIKKYGLLPAEIVVAPRGKVLMTAFVGKTPFAWVMHHPEAPNDMQLLCLPSEEMLSISLDPLFHPPVHVGSFFKTDKSGMLPSAWHCFMFMPIASGAIIRPN